MDSIILDLFSDLILPISILYLVVTGYVFYRQLNRRKLDADRKRYTMEFCLNDDTDYHALFATKKGRTTQIPALLMQLDKIAIGVLNDVFDDEIVYAYYSKYFYRAVHLHSFSMKLERNKTDDPFLYSGFERLVNQWQKEHFEWSIDR